MYSLSWHYKYVIIPLIVIFLTYSGISHFIDLVKYLVDGQLKSAVSLFVGCVFWSLILLPIAWFFVLTTPYKLEIGENGTIKCTSLTSIYTGNMKEITAINHYFALSKIIFPKKVIRLSHLIQNYPSVVSAIRKCNPDINEIKKV